MSTGPRSAPRSALVLGASRGLGLLFVEQYLALGWSVVATLRQGTPVPASLANVYATGKQLEIRRLDVTEPAQIADLARGLADRTFDLLLVIAGVKDDISRTLGQVSTDEFVRLMVTNALGPMRCVEALADRVSETGTIAVMSSGLASVAGNETGGWELYRASKAALNMALRSFAARRTDRRQSVLAIAPGWSRTEMGGTQAPLEPADSVRGVIRTLESLEGKGEHAFVDYRGGRVAW
jgi:NAD(P)-dependent dehydrogenase (short-subunit alcohol dehydrogenase family)